MAGEALRRRRARVVAALVVPVLIAVAVGFRLLAISSPSDPFDEDAATASPPAAVPDPADHATASESRNESRPPRKPAARSVPLTGTRSRFQRRLALGTGLARLRDTVSDRTLDDRGLAMALDVARPHCLFVDGVDAWDLGTPRSLLEHLTRPDRQRTAFRLCTRSRTDDYGSGAPVRVWTRGSEYASELIDAATSLVGTLSARFGDGAPAGHDVLATPGMGGDVFPAVSFLREYAWGFYVPTDALAVVDTSHSEWIQRRVLLHELVHAWHVPRASWTSRFLNEGLAEYLSRLRASDAGVEVPPERFADSFAALLALVATSEARGVSFGGISVRAMSRLSPVRFYSLGQFGYLVALTAIARVSHVVLERALRDGTEEGLLDAVGSLSWADLLAFARAHAEGGDPERGAPLPEVPPDGLDVLLDARDVRHASEAMAEIGAVVPENDPVHPTFDPLEAPVALTPARRDRVATVLAALARQKSIAFATEATAAMDEPFDLPTGWNPAVGPVDLVAHRPTRRSDLVLALAEDLRRAGVEAREVVTLSDPVARETLPWGRVHEPFGLLGFEDWAEGRPSQTGLVVFIASRAAPTQLALPRPAWPYRPSAVLVVDLGRGDSSALAVAQAFARLFRDPDRVAYWDPSQPLR